MLILIMGKNSSGKSVFAEQMAVDFQKTRYYIATMKPYGDSGMARVYKHQKQRAGMGFTTLERPYNVSGADIPPNTVALLEDVSNLLANAMFEKHADAAEVLADITALCSRTHCVVAVTISEFENGTYDEETLRYMRALAWLNEQLWQLAKVVVEMKEGLPIYRKGAPDELA